MALDRVAMPSPNFSSRGGTAVRLIVLHTAEGSTTIESLGNWFANPANQVSSHAGADDKPNTVGIYVQRPDKAWTAANANPYSIQIELCGFASWTADEWDQHPNMLANTAAWIAEEAAAFGIPIVRLSAAEAQGGGTGVCQHVDLGAAGGGHWDCGDAFPMDRVLQMAQGGTPQPQPEPTPPEEDDVANYTICAVDGKGTQYVTDMVETWRAIQSEADFNATLVCLRASGAKVYETGLNTPVSIPQETLDAIQGRTAS